MNFRLRPVLSIAVLCAAIAVCGPVGCKKPFIRVYLAPKDSPAPSAAETSPASADANSKPKLSYRLPAGWTEAAPNSVSLLAFNIKSGGAEANVAVTPLPNLAGREALVVNMWRDQAGLPALDEAELSKTLEPVEIGGEKGQMFEVLGAREGGDPLRIITAFVHHPDASWFYKLAGNEALVTAQKPSFVEFLKSVRVTHEASVASAESISASRSEAAPTTWHGPVPEGWQPLEPGSMQVAKFAVPEKDGAKAEVFVSVFPNDTGGTLGNVNRWRSQLGLPDVDQTGLANCVTPLDPALPDAILVDLKNDPRALLGAIVPREGRWWFYKMLGHTPAVNAARDSFIAFATTPP